MHVSSPPPTLVFHERLDVRIGRHICARIERETATQDRTHAAVAGADSVQPLDESTHVMGSLSGAGSVISPFSRLSSRKTDRSAFAIARITPASPPESE